MQRSAYPVAYAHWQAEVTALAHLSAGVADHRVYALCVLEGG